MSGHKRMAYSSNPKACLGNVTEKLAKGGFHPVKRPGALTAKANAAGEGVQEFASKHQHDSGLTGQQARFAKVAKTWHHGK